MKEFLKELARWWDDPMTTAVFAAIGASVLLGELHRASRSVDEAHKRIDRVEETVKYEIGWITARLELSH